MTRSRLLPKLTLTLCGLNVILTALNIITIAIFWNTRMAEKAKNEREKAFRGQEAVEKHLNELSKILLEEDLEKNEKLKTITRATTFALLRSPDLNGQHKGQVIEYLSEMKLVQTPKSAQKNQTPIISLEGANLEEADLMGVNLEGANLEEANLVAAYLRNAHLNYAHLRRTHLFGANLMGANLVGASVTSEQLNQAKLCQTKLPQEINLDPNRDCLW
jgi:uncharacterized protein YjbI with pentapeptide repeats